MKAETPQGTRITGDIHASCRTDVMLPSIGLSMTPTCTNRNLGHFSTAVIVGELFNGTRHECHLQVTIIMNYGGTH